MLMGTDGHGDGDGDGDSDGYGYSDGECCAILRF
jgi:hypothetical protein